MIKKFLFSCVPLMVLLSGCTASAVEEVLSPPEFADVSVHDPSAIKADDTFYIIGSHMQFAKSQDLMKWEQISNSVSEDTLFENIREELAEEFEYAQTDTLWASDIQQFKNGKYYLYYCLCQGTSPLSVMGVAVSDSIEGPYEKVESFLYSGTSPQFGEAYNAAIHPNAIDPHVFYDNEGKLWMVYGSYSGGIFILEMDDETGLPKDRNSYGTHLMGGNHSRIEAPYIQYNQENGYYYLFTSFGGLDADGGYNLRVARSKNPDGPYEDSQGNPMAEVKGKFGTVFDDASIQDFGTKIMGNFLYTENTSNEGVGYVSPGHNSTYYDEETNQYYLIFHTRFPNSGEYHSVRVHQMFFTEAGWPVVSPLRYSEETIADYTKNQVTGVYTLISFDKFLTDDLKEPQEITVEKNGTIKGDRTGTWELAEKNSQEDSSVVIDDTVYKGKFLSGWDENQQKQVMTFTGTSEAGVPLFIVRNEE
ncbi:glycoside hydrolase family 43 protein [Enterococcus casseliflavus]|uniref:glycoside hydrolase family 43 protein n=1 Tax=Enterococcus casseliflavus TaxID=37734 RepID=UPI00115E39CF|nr:glycoside hydrolase family 43 protein [Enterococcus casseliflavus]MDT2978539.1 glycoside hydrolase family 43 protein [Enterococcus casseliflavus]MDY2549218.1 glycoside hydrolase family 43 protein [Enterococcus casseliflavus]MEB6211349.1 glycoside hydrolase family 43 protein [Enterococcus casseliflavus]